MADLTIVPSDVKMDTIDGSKPVIARYICDEAINAGQVVSILPSGLAGLHDVKLAGYEQARGIALNSASKDQPITLIESGFVELGTVSSAGEVLVASQTSGMLAPVGDLVSTNEVVFIGFMYSSAVLKVDIDNLGISKA